MNDSIDLRAYLAIALKWWWLFLLFTGLAASIGYATSIRKPTFYQATAIIMVGQSIQSTNLSTNDLYLSERLGDTYAELAKRQPVLQGAVDALQLPDPWQSLRGRVSVNQIEGTQLLAITVAADSANEAEVTADEIARQLVRLSPTELQKQETDETQRFMRQRLAELQAKIEAGQARLESLETSMSGQLSIEQVQAQQQEINTLEGLIAGWESNHTQILLLTESNRSPNYLAIVESAQSQAIRPNVKQDTMLAGIMGLLLAAGIVYLLEYLDDTIKSKSDLSHMLGLSPLGAISQIQDADHEQGLLSTDVAFSPVGEAYRMIRSNIRFMSVDRVVKAIVITSPVSSEGKSTTAANLAVVMARVGLKTILVDADLRRPTQHSIFNIPESYLMRGGLTDLLCEPEAEIAGYLRKTHIKNLRLLTSGPLPPNPSELLDSQRMEQLLHQLTEVADAVIFDSPPAAVVTDAAVLASKADGVILIIEAGRTRLGEARQALFNLQQAGANILGGIINRASIKNGGYYYYNASYASHPPGNGDSKLQQFSHQRRHWWRHWLPFLR